MTENCFYLLLSFGNLRHLATKWRFRNVAINSWSDHFWQFLSTYFSDFEPRKASRVTKRSFSRNSKMLATLVLLTLLFVVATTGASYYGFLDEDDANPFLAGEFWVEGMLSYLLFINYLHYYAFLIHYSLTTYITLFSYSLFSNYLHYYAFLFIIHQLPTLLCFRIHYSLITCITCTNNPGKNVWTMWLRST